MTTLMQAVTRVREDEQFPPDGVVPVRLLQGHFQQPGDRGSVRRLIAAMMARGAQARPYAVILCRFKGDAPHADEGKWGAFFRQAFTRGSGGLVEYWRDASLGKIDVGGSRVFGWVEVDMKRVDAGFPPVRRGDLTDAAIRAVQGTFYPVTGAMGDPLTGFFNQISCYMYRDTGAGKPIDGSTDGNTNKTNLTAPFDGEVTAHEMGHSLGMSHDADVTGDTNYHDACCIMSQSGSFALPPWGVVFGPAVCLPHLVLQNWMYNRRMLFDGGAWATQPNGITWQMAPNSDPIQRAFLGASLTVPGTSPEWAYLLEVVTANGWNQAIPGMPLVMVRRTSSQTDLPGKTTCMFLNKVNIPVAGSTIVYHEPSGNTTFTVSLVSARGPIVSVHAKKG
jgi:hypothetical protein